MTKRYETGTVVLNINDSEGLNKFSNAGWRVVHVQDYGANVSTGPRAMFFLERELPDPEVPSRPELLNETPKKA